jgi:hypothetical protein
MKTLLLAVALFAFSAAAQADTVLVNASGSFSALDFSFTASYDWDTVANSYSNLSFSQQGLDPFSLSSINAAATDFTNDTGDLLQIDWSNFLSKLFPSLGSYNHVDIDLETPGTLYYSDATSTLTVTEAVDTPEPASGAFVLCGLLLVALAAKSGFRPSRSAEA